MFVMITRGAGTPHPSRQLVEMTAKELREAQAQPMGREFERWNASDAHSWVKCGGLHSTALWVDFDGKVRRASPGT